MIINNTYSTYKENPNKYYFTDLRAGLEYGQICTGYMKDGEVVTFPIACDRSELTPIITTDTSVLKNSNYLEIGSGIDLFDYSALVNNSLKELVLHDISNIGPFLCEGDSSLERVVIENCTFNNMSWTFKSCSSLINMPNIPNTVYSMDNTFSQCSKLTTTTEIPSGIVNVGYAFEGCSEIITIKFTGTNPPIYNNTLAGCTKLTTIYVPSESIDKWKTASGWDGFADKIVGY